MHRNARSKKKRQNLLPQQPLARAAREIVERNVQYEADGLSEGFLLDARRDLVREAVDELDQIRARVRRQIEITSDLSGRTTDFKFCVGNGVLELSNAEALPFYEPLASFNYNAEVRGAYPRSGWHVTAFANLEIQQRNYDRRGPRGVQFSWKSILMFAKHPAMDEYRWWEVSFYSLADFPENWKTYAISPTDPGFDIALSGELFVTQIAFGPVPCDGEDEKSSRDRWLALLAKAVVSDLYQNSPPIPLTDEYLKKIL